MAADMQHQTDKTPTPLWLDCDTGHDDAFAILLAAHHPNVNLLGISTVYGNASLENTTYNTRAICKAVGREDIPIYVGAAKPFCREVKHAPDIHGESGLDGTTLLPIPTAEVKKDRTAVQAMYEALIATPKGTAWLVPTGALTNAALLFAVHPDLVEHIAGLSIMGGAIGNHFTDAPMGRDDRIGNVTPFAEFNIYIDPEAAKSIFGNPALAAKTTLITLDLTHQFLATKDVQSVLLSGFYNRSPVSETPSKVRALFVEILTFFATTYADVFGIIAGPPVHDPLAVAAAFTPEMFYDSSDSKDRIRYDIEIVTEGAHFSAPDSARAVSQCGRTIATPVPSDGGTGGVRLPKALDVELMWRMTDSCLETAEHIIKGA